MTIDYTAGCREIVQSTGQISCGVLADAPPVQGGASALFQCLRYPTACAYALPMATPPVMAPIQPDYTYLARIIRVIDGDTYDVEIDVGFRMVARMPLRLAHFDTPERYTEKGKLATTTVNQLIIEWGDAVLVRTFKPIDKYGRYLAEVFLRPSSPFSLGVHLEVLGLATPYEGGAKQ